MQTPGNVPPAPTNVQALSTSETSVEVWWDEMPFFNDILGYHVLYTQTAVEDLDLWYKKEVSLTWSAALTGLEPKTMYAIRVAAYTNQGIIPSNLIQIDSQFSLFFLSRIGKTFRIDYS